MADVGLMGLSWVLHRISRAPRTCTVLEFGRDEISRAGVWKTRPSKAGSPAFEGLGKGGGLGFRFWAHLQPRKRH